MTVAGWSVGWSPEEREGGREGRPLPCNFKRGRESGWIVLARPFACMHKQGGGSLYVGGERAGESEGRGGEPTNPFKAPPFVFLRCHDGTRIKPNLNQCSLFDLWNLLRCSVRATRQTYVRLEASLICRKFST